MSSQGNRLVDTVVMHLIHPLWRKNRKNIKKAKNVASACRRILERSPNALGPFSRQMNLQKLDFAHPATLLHFLEFQKNL